MKQEDKELLLKYLCMALPYGVKVHCEEDLAMTLRQIDYQCFCESWENEDIKSHSRWKLPYLRPMSSMTEKDCLSLSKELSLSIRARGGDIYFPHNEDNTLENWNKVNNWLLKNHFDFMGLIPLNLAILVTEQNNPYKN